MRIQLTLYIYLNNIGRWYFFALTFVYKWLDYAKISKLNRVLGMVDSIFNYCFIVYLKCWLLIYTLNMVWWQWSHSEVPWLPCLCLCTLFAHDNMSLVSMLCERPFVHFTGKNINCNWLMWALCVCERHIYSVWVIGMLPQQRHCQTHGCWARCYWLLRQRTASYV